MHIASAEKMQAIKTELIYIKLIFANISSSSVPADLKVWCGDMCVCVLRDPFQGSVKSKLFP